MVGKPAVQNNHRADQDASSRRHPIWAPQSDGDMTCYCSLGPGVGCGILSEVGAFCAVTLERRWMTYSATARLITQAVPMRTARVVTSGGPVTSSGMMRMRAWVPAATAIE